MSISVNKGLNPRGLANGDFICAVQMQSLTSPLIRWHFRICAMLSFTVYHPLSVCVSESLWHIHTYTVCKCYNVDIRLECVEVNVKGCNILWQQYSHSGISTLCSISIINQSSFTNCTLTQLHQVMPDIKLTGQAQEFTAELDIWVIFLMTYCRRKACLCRSW